MAKGGDLTGRMGGAGFGPAPGGGMQPIPLANTNKKDGKEKDPKHPKFESPRDVKKPRGGGGPTGGAPSSVRPKV
jgi:hypothetical protein